MKKVLVSIFLLSLVQSGQAADMSMGVQLGGVADLADAVSKEHTQFGVGPSFGLMYRIKLANYARLRAGVHSHLATGNDRVTWEVEVEGENVRLYDQDHFSMAVGVAFTAGFDVMIPKDLPITPYFGVDVGGMWMGTYHSFSGDTQVLLDPSQNDLDDPKNVDPYTSQLAWLTEFHLGLEKTFGERVFMNFEVGYQMAYMSEQPLKKAPEVYDARREAYGWNAVRFALGAGVMF
jgi:hypothetical protein